MNSKLNVILCNVIIILVLLQAFCIGVSSVDDWTMFGHDAQHIGFSSSTAPETNNLLWSRSLGNDLGWSSPAVVDGRLYISTYDSKQIYCLNAYNGSEIWSHQVSEKIFSSSPAVYDDKVYIGSRDGNLNCLYASNGTEAWTFQTGGWVESSPVVSEDKVYVIAGGRTYCIYSSNGTESWNFPLEASFEQVASPVIAYGNVYILNKFLYCLDANTGVEKWSGGSYNWGERCTPTVIDDKVIVAAQGNGELWCLDATPDDNGDGVIDENDIDDGISDIFPGWDLIWQQDAGNHWGGSSPAVNDGNVYIGSGGTSSLFCYHESDGTEIWNFSEKPTGNLVDSSPAVADGKVYFGSWEGVFWCLDISNGAPVWNYTTGDAITSSPAIYDGRVYVGSRDGVVYCFGTNTAPHNPTITIGSATGIVGVEYYYNVDEVIDLDGHEISYMFDWGDGTSSEWLGKPSIYHSWSSSGTYEVKVMAKDSQGLESGWSEALLVTISTGALPIELPLVINAPLSVYEDFEFDVTISIDTYPIENVEVIFNNQIKTTNIEGMVTLKAPNVEEDSPYTITARKSGYQSRSISITISDKPVERSEGFIYGIITCEGLPVENAKIKISNSKTSWIHYSDSEGRYVETFSVGTYTVTTSKQGYVLQTQEIQVVENTALGLNFALVKKIEVTPEENNIVDYIIQNQIDNIGAEIDTTENHVTFYSDVDVTIEESNSLHEGNVVLKISGEGEGSYFVIYVDGITDPDDIVLNYDGYEIEETKDILGFFNSETDEPEAGWINLQTKNGEGIIIVYTIFSEHTIIISSIVEQIGGPVALLFFIFICIICAVFFAYPFLIWPKPIRKEKK